MADHKSRPEGDEKPSYDIERDATSSTDDSATIHAPAPASGDTDGRSTADLEGKTANPDSALSQSAEAEASAPSDEPEAGRTKLQTTVIVGSLCAALFLSALDITIITTAVPTIAQEFRSSAGFVWIGSAYTLANAACVPIWGKVSDIFGRKNILLTAIAVFWVGSLLCGVSVNMGMLIGARAVQGIGGGGIIVLVNICISDLFSLRQRGFYFGITGIVWAFSSAVGPVLGGVFTSQVTWRWCFYINLPISGVGAVALFFVLKLHNPRTPLGKGLQAIDWVGCLTIIGGTLMVLFGLEFGGVNFPWDSATVICLLVFGAVTIGLFIFNELKFARYPVIPLHLFRDLSTVACFVLTFCHAFVFISGSYWLPLYYQGVLGVSSLLSGVYLLPYAVSLSISSAISGWLIRKTGNYVYLITGGLAIMTLGFGLFYDLPGTPNYAKIILYQIVAGIGIGPNFQAPLIAIQTNAEPRDIASATATFSFVRQIATSISVVIGGVVFANEMDSQRPRLVEELGPSLADQLSGHNAASNVGLVGDLKGDEGRIARGAFLTSMRTMFIVYVAFAAFGLAASLLVRQKRLSKDHKEHQTGLKTLRSRTDRSPANNDK
ncbi:hypothetical protein VD0002_g2832 [Verticillium dahliae]|uniref:Efflux pump dotC n=2 Tax=Verticillium dahliae TaxID=27337 RepID=G2X8M6_VERDV|nr:uncharacterized protein VDAG_06167 [Verticillium dahliae VdLs.17]KAF3342264.1 hypothetical protein VdG2_09224 [Verticillium dahliae VDG2]KAF3359034.1 hypothetical protein VdG1_02596 [Verticillium dahliae VDG1]KAH6697963.1 major facilitator superfamily domain-containing protein [Verticillium dahliae]EGY15313.1 hypothetical protein VDAG_06167 [Verticillium dahliae VdLs.17]PNH28015.1 hypothetical protein BJF96_g8651 [Verticillium dahliae]